VNGKVFSRILAAFVAAVSAVPVFACPVCFGESDSPIARAADLSVLFMMIVTYAVIVGGIAAFFVIRVRARRRALEAAGT
jgi:heme/copper-type cytochrome/quinol oxidase subunit 2